MNLRNVPIKRKLTIIIMLTSSVVLLLVSAPFFAYEWITFRKTVLENTQTIAQIIAANTTAALSFEDDKTANEILSKLEAEKTIIQASLYNRTGKIVARYPAQRSAKEFPSAPKKYGHKFIAAQLHIASPVREGENWLGSLYFITDLSPMYTRFNYYGIVAGIVMAGSLLIALLLSNWLQKQISEPILELAETARSVSEQKDYRVRARKYGKDEVGLFTDAFNQMLTEIHERDLALRQSEERLRLALEASETGTWEQDLGSGLIRWDTYVYHLYGLKAGEFDGRAETLAKYIHPDDRAEVSRQIERTRERGEEFMAEYRVIWPDKSVHYLASRGKVLKEAGKTARMTGVTLDITKSKVAAEALSLLAAIVESSDDAIVGKDLDGKIVSWNAGAQRMFGYTAQETVGRGGDFIVPIERLPEEARTLERIKEGRIEHYEAIRIKKDGSIVNVSMTVSPIKNSSGDIIGASASSRDISDRIRAEEQIRKLNIDLEERVLHRTAELAATNKELEAFTYSVSHDLRAPLRHIDAFAQILEEELKTGLSEASGRYIARIRNGVQSMGQLVDDLLNLSRVGRMEKTQETVDLNVIVNDVVAELRSELEDRRIQWNIGDLPDAECDPGLIKQLFANLISNAAKYTRPRADAIIEIGQNRVDGEVAVFVRDNGVGFNMKYADKLFGVFQRLHRAEEFEGTGVGLATVQRIVHLHNGKIWAEAELDKGATFFFTLAGMKA